MIGEAVAETAATADVIQRYETLRAAVLGEGLNLESRNGLSLFLRRGMWGWLQAAATPTSSSRHAGPVVARSAVEEEHQAVVHLLAALATRSSNRRAHERNSQGLGAPPRA
jgi:hypothetical protein